MFLSLRSFAEIPVTETTSLPVLVINAAQQLVQLYNLLDATKKNLELMQNVYQGVHNAMNIMRTINPDIDPGLYREWQGVQDSMTKIEEIYGKAPRSDDQKVQEDTDQTVAEAVSFNNELFDYSKKLDGIAEDIKSFSKTVSPVGAAKVTAESMGVMLSVLNQGLRAQAKALKLQAIVAERENRKDKRQSSHTIETNDVITRSILREKTTFTLPRL